MLRHVLRLERRRILLRIRIFREGASHGASRQALIEQLRCICQSTETLLAAEDHCLDRCEDAEASGIRARRDELRLSLVEIERELTAGQAPTDEVSHHAFDALLVYLFGNLPSARDGNPSQAS